MALNRSLYAGLFIGFAGGGIGRARVMIDSALGKCPMAVARAYQKELRLTAAHPITDGGHVKAITFGGRTEDRTAKARPDGSQMRKIGFPGPEPCYSRHIAVSRNYATNQS